MDRSKKLAVLVPVFNGGSKLLSTVGSCAKAGLAGDAYELIVVDNCSTDDAISKLPAADDLGAPVHVFRNCENVGRIANWNRAVDHALDLGFEHITFLFVGDQWVPDGGLIDLSQAMLETRARAGFAPFVVTDGEGKRKYVSRRFYVDDKAAVCSSEEFVRVMLRGGMFPLGPLQANIFRVDRDTRPRFDPAMPTRTDVQATLEFVRSACGDIVITGAPFLAWREHAGRFHATMGPARIIQDYMETFRGACLETRVPVNYEKAKAHVILNSVRLMSKEASVKAWPELLSVVARCSRETPYHLKPLHIVEALWRRFALRRHVLQFENRMSRTKKPNMHEQEFLLCCASSEHNLDACVRFRELAARELDWKYVLKTSEVHGMLPLLKARIEKVCPNTLPTGVSTELDRACRANAARNLALTGELLAILQLFQSYGIEVIPFKGPALAERLFGNLGMRQFCDLDILVRPDWVIRAREVLLARGYVSEFDLNPVAEAEYTRAEHAFQLRHPKNGCIIELHWSFGSKDQAFPLAARNVWQRLRRAKLHSREIRSLSDEDLFMYLCLHGAKHRWERLEWICSLAQLATKSREIDWNRLIKLGEATGARRGLHLGLLLIEQVCGVVLPKKIADRARADGKAQSLAACVRTRLFEQEPVHATREFRRQWFYIRCRERVFDRLRIVWFSTARIPHPLARDWDLFRLPARMTFLYYFLRPLRLFRDFGMRILQERRSYEYR